MFEHLLLLAIFGIINVANASIFLLPFVFLAAHKIKLSNHEILFLSTLCFLLIFFTLISIIKGLDGWQSLKSNLVTISLIFFILSSKYVRYDKLGNILEPYVVGSFLYLNYYFYSVDFNVWSLRHANDFKLLGWPTNTSITFVVAYFIIDQSEISKIRASILKCFCTIIGLATLNRVSIIFFISLVILDLARNSRKSRALFLIACPLVFIALFYNFTWISEQAASLLRVEDVVNSLSHDSSFGYRFYVTWQLAIDAIIDSPFFGTGGVGMSGLELLNSNYTDITTESVYLDIFMRYGILFGVVILSLYIFILYQIWKLLRSNVLIYPVVFMFVVSFAFSDVMRFPHIIILLSILYGYGKWKNNAYLYT
jgi:O-antigen ligase